jgi:hypothetical protein
MKNFLDEDPQDWTNPEYSQLHELLVVCTDTWKIPYLRNLAEKAGIKGGTFPEGLVNVRTICRELMRVLGSQGKLRALVERCAAEPSVHAPEFTAMLSFPPRPAPAAAGAAAGQAEYEHIQQLLKDQYPGGVLLLDREPLREQLAALVFETSPAKVLLVRGGPRSGKSHAFFLFAHLAKDRKAECVYLEPSTTPSVDMVIAYLFTTLGVPEKDRPKGYTTDAAGYNVVCMKLLDGVKKKKKPLWIAVDDLSVDQDGVQLFPKQVREFFDQFVLQMKSPAFHQWFRLMLIHYPDGTVPTKWTRELWTEDRTSAADIKREHLLDFLSSWRAAYVKRTILDDELNSIADDVLSQAETPAGGQPVERQRLDRINSALCRAIKKLQEGSQ